MPTGKKTVSPKTRDKTNKLRMRAEEFLLKTPSAIKKMPTRALKDLIEDLQIHQVELEMQGEELRRSQFELEQSRDRYLDLYDFAPVGYFTISDKGIILEANLMVATLLGVERSTFVGTPFFRFIADEDQDLFYLHKNALLKSGHVESCELRLVNKDGEEFHAQLESIVRESDKGRPVGIVSIVQDISERKNAEKELRRVRNATT
jgi:PAS domain S-box-containing protein